MIEIPGDYLEGGGQILRTATALSCICNQPIHVFNIRAKRSKPGLKSQHLIGLKTLAQLFQAKTSGLELESREITFNPSLKTFLTHSIDIDIQTAGAIGLILQPLILISAFRGDGFAADIRGGTAGLGAIPVDYCSNVIFPILSRSGLKANLEIIKRGYYPKGGGKIRLTLAPIKPQGKINLAEPGRLVRIEGISIASVDLKNRAVAERQADKAQEILNKKYAVNVNIKTEYARTFSTGTELNLYGYTQNGCILGSDARGERGKTAQVVAQEAASKLIREIDSGAAVDVHLADNLIPWLGLLGGAFKTSEISLHTSTNIWVTELFLGKIFKVEDTTIICEIAHFKE